jgi:riboflavin synthase
MFTGIVDATGKILKITPMGDHMLIEVEVPYKRIQSGESIALDGVCLTAIPLENGHVQFDVSVETLSKTYFNKLHVDKHVNLERALKSNSRMGGHYVTGHVDTTAQVIDFEQCDNYVKLTIGGFNNHQMMYLMPKGSISINGVSLTINAVLSDKIELMLVPHTLSNTTLEKLQLGDVVNIEFDYMTRVVAHQLKYLLNNFDLKAL